MRRLNSSVRAKQAFTINAKAVKFYLNYIRYHRHFEVFIGWNSLPNYELNDTACDGILDTIVAPLLDVSSEVYIYHNSRTIVKPVPKPPIPPSVTRHPTRLAIDKNKTSIDDCRPFWRWALRGIYGASGNLVIQVPLAVFPKALITQHCFNPAIVTNLRAVVSPRAVSYCKRAVATGDSVYCVFHKNAMSIALSFFSNYRALSLLYRHCVKYCQFTMKAAEKQMRTPISASKKRR